MSKKPSRKVSKKTKNVQVIVEGINRVALVFPKGTDLKVKKKVSVSDLAKVLGAAPASDVEGQCSLEAARAWVRSRVPETRTPSAIGGVRG